MMEKLYNKYQITKVSGEPVNPDAQYFVLRIDTDPAARVALLAYATEIEDTEPVFARQLYDWVSRCQPFR